MENGEHGKKYRILIVDDDTFLVNMYSLKFERAGFSVETALSAQEALEKLENAPSPDAILLDIVMPTMDGLELLKKIKTEKLGGSALCIVLSNQSQSIDIAKAKEIGADGYIVKASSIPSEVVTETLAILRKNGR